MLLLIHVIKKVFVIKIIDLLVKVKKDLKLLQLLMVQLEAMVMV